MLCNANIVSVQLQFRVQLHAQVLLQDRVHLQAQLRRVGGWWLVPGVWLLALVVRLLLSVVQLLVLVFRLLAPVVTGQALCAWCTVPCVWYLLV